MSNEQRPKPRDVISANVPTHKEPCLCNAPTSAQGALLACYFWSLEHFRGGVVQMARCWTCGTPVSSYSYECSSCRDVVRELKDLKITISGGLDELAKIQETGFHRLSDQLSEIGTILEWGFGELTWQLQQQTAILLSIDHTLKTPSETQANEWRQMAEKLRQRGVLNESEEFFLKALNSNRLDYRIYVGLACTYLQSNKFDEARAILERSLPHAPKQEIDCKSLSYRLIGHIYACMEDYDQAVAILRASIELSPEYSDGHYDYAQYCAQKRDTESCLPSLQKAIVAKPLYWDLAQQERNFDLVKDEVQKLLNNMLSGALSRAEGAIADAEHILRQAREETSKAEQAAMRYEEKPVQLESRSMYKDADSKLKLAQGKVASKDYTQLLEVPSIAEEAIDISKKAKSKADQEYREYVKRYIERRKDIIKGGVIGGVIGSLVGGCGGLAIGFTGKNPAAFLMGIIFITVGVIGGVLKKYIEYKRYK